MVSKVKLNDSNSTRVPAEDLQIQLSSIFRAVGTSERHAEIAAKVLVAASVRGVDTHGVANVVNYSKNVETGVYTVPQETTIITESETTALVSGGNGIGLVSAYEAMEIAIEKAKKHGIGMVSIKDGHHVGMVAYYASMALEHDMIGMSMTTAAPAVRPALGAKKMLGTNPIGFAAPAGEERDFFLDMATSTVASGKVGLARRIGVPIPAGWAVTSGEGEEITEPPNGENDDWALNPLGNTREQGSHKGYGLAVLVDILCGVLSGGGFSSQLDRGENMSWVMAIDIAKFRDITEFKSMMDDMIREMHGTPTLPGVDRVLVAGDPEADAMDDRLANGVPVENGQYKAIRDRAAELSVDVII
ncbi:Ldh family oxidoreductase [Dehalococcoides mccartyi]|nr:Ldh family oxidoreductase [Dehalococcoides mccartyi]